MTIIAQLKPEVSIHSNTIKKRRVASAIFSASQKKRKINIVTVCEMVIIRIENNSSFLMNLFLAQDYKSLVLKKRIAFAVEKKHSCHHTNLLGGVSQKWTYELLFLSSS